MKKFGSWLWYSSQVSEDNVKKVSLTVKSFLPFLALLGISKFLPTNDASNLIDAVANIVVLWGQVLTAFLTIVGIVRKVWNTFYA